MTAPRSTSLRALRALSQQHTSATTLYCRRRLHITGAFSAQPANRSDKTTLYSSRTLADLKAECERRALRSGGSKTELVDRLSNHDLLQSRAFSIAMKRIDGHIFGRPSEARQFNTSRANKAVNDSSAMDFVHMPPVSSFHMEPASSPPRVPILFDSHTDLDGSSLSPSASASSPMKPQIHAVSEIATDMSVSPMSEVVDNHALEIDPFKLTETVGRSRDGENLQKLMASLPPKGILVELWSGMVDDILGPQPSTSNRPGSLKK